MRYLLWFNARRLAWAIVGLPLFLAIVYFLFFAADRYVSEAIITVRQAQGGQASGSGFALLIAGVNPPSRDDTLYLRQYIHSLELLRKLEAKLQVRAHFEHEKLDPFYRLYPRVSQEWLLEYYRSRVEVTFDETASLLTVRTQGFTPQFAQSLNQAILDESERFVNSFSQRMAREQMEFSEAEVQRAIDKVKVASTALMEFQARNGQLDPVEQARAAGRIEGELQAQITKSETELRAMRAYLNEAAYPVQTQQQQLDAMRRQLAAEQARATRGSEDRRVNKLALQFQEHMVQANFAQEAYKLALTSVEIARVEASRKIKSLAVIEPPSLPQSAALPRAPYTIATLFIVCCLLYGVARLTLATIREHHD